MTHRRAPSLRLHLSVLLLPAFVFPYTARAVEVAIPNISVQSSSVVDIPVWLAAAPDRVAALQFDVIYDADALTLEAASGDAARAFGKVLYTSDPARGVKRFVIAGSNGDFIANGSVVMLSVSIADAVKQGAFDLRFAAPVGATPEGDALPLTTIDGQITVFAPEQSGPPSQPEPPAEPDLPPAEPELPPAEPDLPPAEPELPPAEPDLPPAEPRPELENKGVQPGPGDGSAPRFVRAYTNDSRRSPATRVKRTPEKIH